MIWRALVAICGVGVIAAATHVNVLHAGGYQSDGAAIIIAMAALLTVGMGFVGLLWCEHRRSAAAILLVCLLCGEIYWLCLNAEREIALREIQALPAVEARQHRVTAEERLVQALTAKGDADTAAASEAAKPGCKSNCAQLLSAAQLRANQEVADARAALDKLPHMLDANGLAERLGVVSWAWDLWMAGLRSIAIMGASIAVGLALHPRQKVARTAPEADARRAPLPVRRKAPPLLGRATTDTRAIAHTKSAREHVSEFMMECVRPDPTGTASLRELHSRYLPWCSAKSKDPLPLPALGQELRKIIDAIGLVCEPDGGDVTIRGASLTS